MGIWKRKNKNYVDLSEQINRHKELKENLFGESSPEIKEEPKEEPVSQGGIFNFFQNTNNPEPEKEESINPETTHPADRRRKLAKRLISITERIEELEKTTTKLNERIEFLERKNQNY